MPIFYLNKDIFNYNLFKLSVGFYLLIDVNLHHDELLIFYLLSDKHQVKTCVVNFIYF